MRFFHENSLNKSYVATTINKNTVRPRFNLIDKIQKANPLSAPVVKSQRKKSIIITIITVPYRIVSHFPSISQYASKYST